MAKESGLHIVPAAYDLAPPLERFALGAGGSNNETFGLRTGAGVLVVKRYRAARGREAVAYEHRLLALLAVAGLPFAVPAPLPTRDGKTLVWDGGEWLALFPLLPGARPDERDPQVAEQVGVALGRLHGALAPLPTTPHPTLRPYGDLEHVHPALPDPAALPLADEDAAWWRAELAAVRAFAGGAYRALPRQLTHGDFTPANTLFAGGRLAAVVDFEHAQPDARAIDLAAGLFFTLRPWETPVRWEAAAALCRGYRRHVQLTAQEAAALPELMRLRNAVSLVWRFGHQPAKAPKRLAWTRATAAWLERHGGKLVAVAQEEVQS
ncbi:MAG TPA: phosphotransferase [Roseiflexaceae bacterium]|nr:phosphotransferase [Roseiflexaceae bacterium]